MDVIVEIKFGQEYAAKIIAFPCLPPIGSAIWIDNFDEALKVVEIEFWENHPNEVTILLDYGPIDDGVVQHVADDLAAHGWKIDHGAALLR